MIRKGKEITKESDLDVDEKIQNHNRKQQILDVLTKVACWIIIVVPILTGLAILISSYHYIKADFNVFAGWLVEVVKGIFYVFVGFLIQNKIISKN